MTFGITIGGRIGPYEITGELGSGGMGVVYRAEHTLLRRPAAIKVLRPELGSHTPALDRFLNEARATTAIRHPGIVEIYDYGHTDDGCAFIAMELLVGATLGARLARHKTLPLAEALVIARRIAAPLAVAHEAGIVHRDLKPDNVFLIRDHEGGAFDQVKLLDFGIARLESAGTRTTAGLILGTPAYMSPEQCRGITDCDHRADLYALGCVMFEALAGEPPFGRDGSMSDLIAAHLTAPIPELSRTTVPIEIRRLVSRLLAKSPADRPRTAAEVVFEIDRHLAVATITPSAAPKPSLRVAIATAAGLALSLAGVGAWVRWRRAAPEPEAILARGSVVIAPSDAGADATTVATAPTIAVDDAPSPRVSQAPPADAKPRAISHPPKPTEVLDDLGSAHQPDVDTTVSP